MNPPQFNRISVLPRIILKKLLVVNPNTDNINANISSQVTRDIFPQNIPDEGTDVLETFSIYNNRSSSDAIRTVTVTTGSNNKVIHKVSNGQIVTFICAYQVGDPPQVARWFAFSSFDDLAT